MAVRTSMQKYFFDTALVKRAVDEANRKALSQAGAFVARRASSSIRKSPNPSAPGRPPHSHRGFVKERIFFAWDPNTQGVVVGPEWLSHASPDALEPLEHGGTITPHRNTRRRRRAIGGSGEIRVSPLNLTMIRQPSQRSRRGEVIYARILTAAQAARANRLNEQLYGPDPIGGRIEARPFMGPALAAEAPKLPPLWADSIRV